MAWSNNLQTQAQFRSLLKSLGSGWRSSVGTGGISAFNNVGHGLTTINNVGPRSSIARRGGGAVQVDPFDVAFGVQQSPNSGSSSSDVVRAITTLQTELTRRLDQISNKLPPGAVA